MESSEPTQRCGVHGFQFVPMPRVSGEFDYGFKLKCPLLLCKNGVLKTDKEEGHLRQ